MDIISLVEDAVLQVQIAEIPAKGLSLKVTDPTWFPGSEVSRTGVLEVEVSLTRRNERIYVASSIDLIMLATCDRCLAEFELPQQITFQVIFDLKGEDPALHAREYECDQDEMDVIFLEDPVIDIGATLAQQVTMAVPQKNLCQSECQGFCSGCGINLNNNKCCCEAGNTESPFSVLSKLTTKKH